VAALHDPPRVEVTGAIDDVPVELGRLAVFAAPLESGRGLASKLLEALAAARPLVLSSWAAGSLSGEAGRTYLVADGPAATADALAGLLADPARRETLGRAGREWVVRHHVWEALLARLQRLAREAAHA
jgi:glycosyltransferase involved in cell wall biosynthesis